MDHWQQITAHFIKQMYQAPAEEAYSLCRRLLRMTMADGLNATTWDVVEAIVDLDLLWSWKELPALLEQYQLPTDREKLRKDCQAQAGTQRTDVT